VFSSTESIETQIVDADVVIGAVLVPGASAPKLILRDHLRSMKLGAVIVDVAIDQGGCFETSRPTTHADPTFEVDGVIHYAWRICLARCLRLELRAQQRDIAVWRRIGG